MSQNDSVDWKPTRFPTYEVSSNGVVRRIRSGGKHFILKPWIGKSGHLYVCAFVDGKQHNTTIRSLVAEAFLGEMPQGRRIEQLDGVKENCAADNLQYVCAKETKTCEHCRREFTTLEPGKRRFCSRECSHSYRKRRVVTKCLQCSSELHAKSSLAKIGCGRFCSKKCWQEFQKGRWYCPPSTREQRLEARQILTTAVRIGTVVRPDQCSGCGLKTARIEGHHADYSKPLDVEWLCCRCHRKRHPSIKMPEDLLMVAV